MKGQALLIGVPALSAEHYGDNRRPLKCLNKNFEMICKMLEHKFDKEDITELKTEDETTWSNVKYELKRLRELSCAEGHFIVIYLVCHGALIDLIDDIQYETDRETNFLCFNDRMVSRGEWNTELSTMGSGSNVFVIVDSCYSQGLDNRLIPKSFQEIYSQNYAEGFEPYVRVAEKYDPDIKNEGKANICTLLSSDKRKTTLGGAKPESGSYFTKALYDSWITFGRSLNYIQMCNYLRGGQFHKPFKPYMKIHPQRKHMTTIFHETPMFLYDTPIEPNEVSDEFEPITLDEVNGKNVTVVMNHPHLPYRYVDSFTWDLVADADNPNLHSLLAQIVRIDSFALEDVDFIGVVIATRNETGILFPLAEGADTPVEINSLYSVSPGDENGLVVLCEIESGNHIIGKKRTRGKVSNTIGE